MVVGAGGGVVEGGGMGVEDSVGAGVVTSGCGVRTVGWTGVVKPWSSC